ncbi:MAG: hypothetical protein ACE5HY_04905 [Candidatus Hydrothermarchaeales archaeon]
MLELTVDEYMEARDGLIRKDLIAVDGTLFQVLDLPKRPIEAPIKKKPRSEVQTLIQQSLWEAQDVR